MTSPAVTIRPTYARVSITPEDGPTVLVQARAGATVTFSSPGPQGAQGPAGAAGASYEHTQASAADVWTIPHNLGFRPTVTVLTTGGLEVLADVQHLSANTLTVTLLAPMAGTARLT